MILPRATFDLYRLFIIARNKAYLVDESDGKKGKKKK
jgi:hypothetical protein